MVLDLVQLGERCRYWQRVLRLNDWEIDLKIARRREMRSSTVVAQVWISGTARNATITLLDPVDFNPTESARMVDMEDSLVHELLHLHTTDLRIVRADEGKTLTAEEIAEERAIEAITGALVRLDRGGA